MMNYALKYRGIGLIAYDLYSIYEKSLAKKELENYSKKVKEKIFTKTIIAHFEGLNLYEKWMQDGIVKKIGPEMAKILTHPIQTAKSGFSKIVDNIKKINFKNAPEKIFPWLDETRKKTPIGNIFKAAQITHDVLKEDNPEDKARTLFKGIVGHLGSLALKGLIVGATGGLGAIPLLLLETGGSITTERVAEYLYDNMDLMADTYLPGQLIENARYEARAKTISEGADWLAKRSQYAAQIQGDIERRQAEEMAKVPGLLMGAAQKGAVWAGQKSIDAENMRKLNDDIDQYNFSKKIDAIKIQSKGEELYADEMAKVPSVLLEIVQKGIEKIKKIDWNIPFPSSSYPMLYSTGLSYVPYDGFPAILHKGERIMTASENRTYSNPARTYTSSSVSRGGNVFNITINGVNKSADDIINELVHKMSEAVNTMGEVAFE